MEIDNASLELWNDTERDSETNNYKQIDTAKL
jgi:hypothetical protein